MNLSDFFWASYRKVDRLLHFLQLCFRPPPRLPSLHIHPRKMMLHLLVLLCSFHLIFSATAPEISETFTATIRITVKDGFGDHIGVGKKKEYSYTTLTHAVTIFFQARIMRQKYISSEEKEILTFIRQRIRTHFL